MKYRKLYLNIRSYLFYVTLYFLLRGICADVLYSIGVFIYYIIIILFIASIFGHFAIILDDFYNVNKKNKPKIKSDWVITIAFLLLTITLFELFFLKQEYQFIY
jgi:hypothetical protein